VVYPKIAAGPPHPVAKRYFGSVSPNLQKQRKVTGDWKCYKVITHRLCEQTVGRTREQLRVRWSGKLSAPGEVYEIRQLHFFL
jgi:hypothetical protein